MQMRAQWDERQAALRAAYSCEYLFPLRELGLRLEEGDGGRNAVVTGFASTDIPKYCWNLQLGDIVRCSV